MQTPAQPGSATSAATTSATGPASVMPQTSGFNIANIDEAGQQQRGNLQSTLSSSSQNVAETSKTKPPSILDNKWASQKAGEFSFSTQNSLPASACLKTPTNPQPSDEPAQAATQATLGASRIFNHPPEWQAVLASSTAGPTQDTHKTIVVDFADTKDLGKLISHKSTPKPLATGPDSKKPENTDIADSVDNNTPNVRTSEPQPQDDKKATGDDTSQPTQTPPIAEEPSKGNGITDPPGHDRSDNDAPSPKVDKPVTPTGKARKMLIPKKPKPRNAGSQLQDDKTATNVNTSQPPTQTQAVTSATGESDNTGITGSVDNNTPTAQKPQSEDTKMDEDDDISQSTQTQPMPSATGQSPGLGNTPVQDTIDNTAQSTQGQPVPSAARQSPVLDKAPYQEKLGPGVIPGLPIFLRPTSKTSPLRPPPDDAASPAQAQQPSTDTGDDTMKSPTPSTRSISEDSLYNDSPGKDQGTKGPAPVPSTPRPAPASPASSKRTDISIPAFPQGVTPQEGSPEYKSDDDRELYGYSSPSRGDGDQDMSDVSPPRKNPDPTSADGGDDQDKMSDGDQYDPHSPSNLNPTFAGGEDGRASSYASSFGGVGNSVGSGWGGSATGDGSGRSRRRRDPDGDMSMGLNDPDEDDEPKYTSPPSFVTSRGYGWAPPQRTEGEILMNNGNTGYLTAGISQPPMQWGPGTGQIASNAFGNTQTPAVNPFNPSTAMNPSAQPFDPDGSINAGAAPGPHPGLDEDFLEDREEEDGMDVDSPDRSARAAANANAGGNVENAAGADEGMGMDVDSPDRPDRPARPAAYQSTGGEIENAVGDDDRPTTDNILDAFNEDDDDHVATNAGAGGTIENTAGAGGGALSAEVLDAFISAPPTLDDDPELEDDYVPP